MVIVSTLTCYAKLHIESERRAHNLANEMWLQQAEVSRIQERAVQDSLNAIVKQNRRLLEDNENLMKKNEDLLSNYDGHAQRRPLEYYNQVLEQMRKSNTELRTKFCSSLSAIDDMEKELQLLQNKNKYLENQVKNSNAQLLSSKGILYIYYLVLYLFCYLFIQFIYLFILFIYFISAKKCNNVHPFSAELRRVNADVQLQIASLNYELFSKNTEIKETSEAGDMLLRDILNLKRSLESSGMEIDWSKFKASTLIFCYHSLHSLFGKRPN